MSYGASNRDAFRLVGHLASFTAVHKIATRSEVCGHRPAPGPDRLRGLCRVGPGNFTPSLSQVGSKTGAPV
jgi:hypothetical protein